MKICLEVFLSLSGARHDLSAPFKINVGKRVLGLGTAMVRVWLGIGTNTTFFNVRRQD